MPIPYEEDDDDEIDPLSITEGGWFAHAESIRDDPNFARCPRCRNCHRMIMNYDGLCDRCCKVLVDMNLYVEEINAAYKKQFEYYRSKQKPSTNESEASADS